MVPKDNPWTTHSSREVYDNPWIRVVENQIIDPSGEPGIYGVVHFKHRAVGIIPVDEDNHTWLVGQYRYTLDAYSWEIPQGGAAPGEEAVDCARRELAEETGLRADRYDLLLRMHLSNCVTDELSLTYVARGVETGGRPEPDGNEAPMQIRHLPLEEAWAMVADGRITDAPSVAGLLQLKAVWPLPG